MRNFIPNSETVLGFQIIISKMCWKGRLEQNQWSKISTNRIFHQKITLLSVKKSVNNKQIQPFPTKNKLLPKKAAHIHLIKTNWYNWGSLSRVVVLNPVKREEMVVITKTKLCYIQLRKPLFNLNQAICCTNARKFCNKTCKTLKADRTKFCRCRRDEVAVGWHSRIPEWILLLMVVDPLEPQ